MSATTLDGHVRLALRDYQQKALDRVAEAESRGVRRLLVVMATGLGKTIVFAALAERRGGRALILAHRDELVTQAATKVAEVWPGVNVGVVKAERDDVHAHVVVASVQTLARASRLERLCQPWEDPGLLSAADRFGLVVVDEAHHARADTYGRVLDRLGAGAQDGPLLLGATATPDRGDGRGLDVVFDEVVAANDILFGIREGYLSDLQGTRLVLDFDMSDVRVRQGDYDQGQAGRLMEQAHGAEVIAKAWTDGFPSGDVRVEPRGRRTLVFTPTVATAGQVADAFRARGVAAEHVHASTPLDERRAMLRRFSSGETEVMANCGVLTEGYDEPRVDCVVVARPTRSRALYVQMIGRGTRRHPDKTSCLVIDAVGASKEHSLVTIPSLFGVEAKAREAIHSVIAAVGAMEEEEVRAGRLRAEEADLFAKVGRSPINWIALHQGEEVRRYVCTLGAKDLPTVVLAQMVRGDDDSWLAGLRAPDGKRSVLIREVNLEMAMGVGEDYVRKNAASQALVRADAHWRKGRPSDKALAAAGKWRLKVDPKWTAGELSDALDRHVERIKHRPKTRRK